MIAEDELRRVWLENVCGDLTCENRRLNAALAVLRGTTTHLRLATRVEDELAQEGKFRLTGQATMDEYGRIVEAATHVLDNAGLDTARGHTELRDALDASEKKQNSAP